MIDFCPICNQFLIVDTDPKSLNKYSLPGWMIKCPKKSKTREGDGEINHFLIVCCYPYSHCILFHENFTIFCEVEKPSVLMTGIGKDIKRTSFGFVASCEEDLTSLYFETQNNLMFQ